MQINFEDYYFMFNRTEKVLRDVSEYAELRRVLLNDKEVSEERLDLLTTCYVKVLSGLRAAAGDSYDSVRNRRLISKFANAYADYHNATACDELSLDDSLALYDSMHEAQTMILEKHYNDYNAIEG